MEIIFAVGWRWFEGKPTFLPSRNIKCAVLTLGKGEVTAFNGTDFHYYLIILIRKNNVDH